MGFFNVLFKIIASLIGAPLVLGGFLAFCGGILILFGVFQEFSRELGILVVIGAVLSLTFGTILGKYAAGDYDDI